jgi:hypothetical protein
MGKMAGKTTAVAWLVVGAVMILHTYILAQFMATMGPRVRESA